MWESLGFLFAFVLQTQVCVDVKLWILVAFLSAGMVGYLTVEAREAAAATGKRREQATPEEREI